MLGRCLPHIVPNVLLAKREVNYYCIYYMGLTLTVKIDFVSAAFRFTCNSGFIGTYSLYVKENKETTWYILYCQSVRFKSLTLSPTITCDDLTLSPSSHLQSTPPIS